VIHLDTSFLVDLLREAGRRTKGPASTFLEGAAGEEVGISVHVACELFAGAELADRPAEERRRVEKLCAGLAIACPDERYAPAYGRLLAWQHKHGGRIATMDLLIATTAVVEGAPLVTRNVKDFSRVPGLDLLSY
jgi:predicted nucleic acid-binding protein